MQKQAFFFLLSLFGQFCAFSPIGLAYAEPLVESSGALPVRRSGLWRISTLPSAVGLEVSEACVGPKDSIIGDEASDCEKPTVAREGEQVVVTVVCAGDGRRLVTSLLFTGNFRTWYRAQGKITTVETSAETHSGFTIDAKFVRPDCADLGSPK